MYRYGFNGKENDNEVKGTGNQQDYGFRIYDPRLGRFLSVDPLTKGYPELTPYQFASNEPISNIDLDGLERSPAGKVGQNEEIVRDNTAVALYPNEIPVILKQKENAPKLKVIMDAAARPMATVEDRNKALFRSNINNPDNIGGNAAFSIYSDLHRARAEYSEGNYGMGTLYLFNAGINTVTLTGAGPALGAKGKVNVPGRVETFYRGVSSADYEAFIRTGKLPATGETVISPTKEFAATYGDVLLEINVKFGTLKQLENIGVRNPAKDHPYSSMPISPTGWGKENALFKLETNKAGLQQVNIGLGKGEALRIFNENVQSVNVLNR